MRYPRLYRNSVKFKFTVFILVTLSSYVEAALYPFGPDTNDELLTFSLWDQGSNRIQLLSDVSLLGNGFISNVWVSINWIALTKLAFLIFSLPLKIQYIALNYV